MAIRLLRALQVPLSLQDGGEAKVGIVALGIETEGRVELLSRPVVLAQGAVGRAGDNESDEEGL
jgi:hypothetical protein